MSYVELTQNISKNLLDLRAGEPEVMKGFGALAPAASIFCPLSTIAESAATYCRSRSGVRAERVIAPAPP